MRAYEIFEDTTAVNGKNPSDNLADEAKKTAEKAKKLKAAAAIKRKQELLNVKRSGVVTTQTELNALLANR